MDFTLDTSFQIFHLLTKNGNSILSKEVTMVAEMLMHLTSC